MAGSDMETWGAWTRLALFDPRGTDEQRALRRAALADWEEAKPSLSTAARRLAEDLVELCEQFGWFSCEPGCSVDVLDDGNVMFDWNDGSLPVYTVVITPEAKVIDVVRFDGYKMTGEGLTLDSVRVHMPNFVQQRGKGSWSTLALLDLSLSRSAEAAVTGHGLLSIPLRAEEPFLSSPPMARPLEISSEPENMWGRN